MDICKLGCSRSCRADTVGMPVLYVLVRMYICMYWYLCIYVCTSTYVYMFVCMYVCMWTLHIDCGPWAKRAYVVRVVFVELGFCGLHVVAGHCLPCLKLRWGFEMLVCI